MNKAEKKIVKAIKKYGCHITSVFDPEGKDPDFTYTTGLIKSYQAPELIITGMEYELASALINEYQCAVESTHKFEPMVYYKDILRGFEVTFGAVSKSAKEKFMLSACWFHDDSDFAALQLIWPTTSGVWPWEEPASEYFKEIQLCLNEDLEW